jgi:hypothetical protein
MKAWAVILAGLHAVVAVAVPTENAVDASESVQAELSYLDRPASAGYSVNEGVPQGVFIEPEIDPKKSATPGGEVSVIKYGYDSSHASNHFANL